MLQDDPLETRFADTLHGYVECRPRYLNAKLVREALATAEVDPTNENQRCKKACYSDHKMVASLCVTRRLNNFSHNTRKSAETLMIFP